MDSRKRFDQYYSYTKMSWFHSSMFSGRSLSVIMITDYYCWNSFSFVDLKDFADGKPLTIEVVHADGSKDTIKANHTYNATQIGWFKEGSALNMIKKQNKA